jgi:hypothetical protein
VACGEAGGLVGNQRAVCPVRVPGPTSRWITLTRHRR